MRQGLEEDLTSETIACAMGIGLCSVNTQLERLFMKLGVHTCTAMAVRVMLEVIEMMTEETDLSRSIPVEKSQDYLGMR